MTGLLKMGYYRGVPQRPKREEMDKIAAEMRAHYLNHGKGCKTRAKVIAQRLDAIDRRLAGVEVEVRG